MVIWCFAHTVSESACHVFVSSCPSAALLLAQSSASLSLTRIFHMLFHCLVPLRQCSCPPSLPLPPGAFTHLAPLLLLSPISRAPQTTSSASTCGALVTACKTLNTALHSRLLVARSILCRPDQLPRSHALPSHSSTTQLCKPTPMSTHEQERWLKVVPGVSGLDIHTPCPSK